MLSNGDGSKLREQQIDAESAEPPSVNLLLLPIR
jgi:hypothetical protein